MKRHLQTEKELWDWFRYMRNFDLTRLEERRQLIDVFVNTVFLYNDRFLLTLNFGYGSKTVLFTDIPCSDKVACGRPYRVFITNLSYGHSIFIKIFNVTLLMAKITQRHLWQYFHKRRSYKSYLKSWFYLHVIDNLCYKTYTRIKRNGISLIHSFFRDYGDKLYYWEPRSFLYEAVAWKSNCFYIYLNEMVYQRKRRMTYEFIETNWCEENLHRW